MTSVPTQTAIRIRSEDGEIDETFGPFHAEDAQRIFMAMHENMDEGFSIEAIQLNLVMKDHGGGVTPRFTAGQVEPYQSFIDELTNLYGYDSEETAS